MCPGVCAPSMTVQMPRAFASRIERSIGNTSAVGDVMWLRNSTRVRSVNALDNRVSERGLRDQRHRNLDDDDAGAGAARHIGPGFLQRRIFVVGRDDLVARLEVERLGDDVESLGGVDEADDVVGLCAEFGGKRDARHAHAIGQVAPEEGDRLALQLELPVLIGLENLARAGAERAVVEEDHVVAKQEVPREIFGHVSAPSAWDRGHRATRLRRASSRAR